MPEDELHLTYFAVYPGGDRSKIRVVDLDSMVGYERSEFRTVDDQDFPDKASAIRHARKLATRYNIRYELFESRYGGDRESLGDYEEEPSLTPYFEKPTLRDLTEWAEIDTTALLLGASLGLYPYPPSLPGTDPWAGLKWIFWTNNKLGNRLYEMVKTLVELGVLEHRVVDGDDHYRWNSTFDPQEELG